MATEIEYEKTYLAKFLPENLDIKSSVVIRDVYVPDSVPHANLRLRNKGDHYEITKKVPVKDGDSSVQYEHTIELDAAEWKKLAKCSQKTFVKRRYYTKINGHDVEVDVFGEKLAGLVLIDFEFATEEEKDAFVMPDVCLADVTQEEFVAGGFISGRSFEDIAPQLEKYHYKKIGE